MFGRVDELKAAAVTSIELPPSLVRTVAVNIEIIPDNVDRAGRILTGERVHECDQVRGSAAATTLREHLASPNVERGEQRNDTTASVLELVSTEGADGGKPAGESSAQRLNLSLLVDAHDRRSRRRSQIQVTDPANFRREIGIGAMQPQSIPMRSQLAIAQNATDFTAAEDPASIACERGTQRAQTPRRPRVSRPIARELDQLAADLRRNSRWSSTTRTIVERRDTRRLREPSSPQPYRIDVAR